MLIVLVTIGETPSPPTGERNSQLPAKAAPGVSDAQSARPNSEPNGAASGCNTEGAITNQENFPSSLARPRGDGARMLRANALVSGHRRGPKPANPETAQHTDAVQTLRKRLNTSLLSSLVGPLATTPPFCMA